MINNIIQRTKKYKVNNLHEIETGTLHTGITPGTNARFLSVEDDTTRQGVAVSILLGDITKLQPDTCIIDTENHGDEIVQWLENNGIVKRTGICITPWHCYPIVKINKPDRLPKLKI